MSDNEFEENPIDIEEDNIDEEDELTAVYEKAGEIGADELQDEIHRIRRKYNRYTVLMGIGMVILFVLMVVTIVVSVLRIQYAKRIQNQLDEWQTNKEEVDFDSVLKKLDGLHNYLSTYFLFDADPADIGNRLYHELLNSYDDPYTVYYDKEEYSALQQSSSAKYTGIGVTVALDYTGYIRINEVFEGSGAEIVGLQKDDIIKAIDGVDIKENALEDSTLLMKGEEGSTVNVTIYRQSEDREFDVDIERRKIDLITVEGRMLDDEVGYIAITQFGDASDEQFIKTFEKLEAEGMKALMIDVRYNPGGQLESVKNMLDYLLPAGLIIYTEDKNGNRIDYTSDASCKELPMVVLTNDKSASASEVFAGALKDYSWAKLVGTKTFGKGIVQIIHSLGDGTAIKVTVARYFTPLGTCIHGIGVEPDFEVEEGIDESKDDWTADSQAYKGYQVLLEELGNAK